MNLIANELGWWSYLYDLIHFDTCDLIRIENVTLYRRLTATPINYAADLLYDGIHFKISVLSLVVSPD